MIKGFYIILILTGIVLTGCDSLNTGNLVSNDPQALYKLEKRVFVTGEVVNFNNFSSGANSFTWDFDDGQTSKEKSPNHIYYKPGDYYPKLWVSNRIRTVVFEYKISIVGAPITKDNLDGDESSGNIQAESSKTDFSDEKLSLSASVISVGEKFDYQSNSDRRLLWEFTPGESVEALRGKFTYKTPGKKTIRLLSPDGAQVLDSAHMQVFSASVTPQELYENEEFSFSAQADFNTKWDFGDGTILEETQGKAKFEKEGKYIIKLIDASDNQMLKRFIVGVEKKLVIESALINDLLSQLANHGKSIKEKDQVTNQLGSYCSNGMNTPVLGKETGTIVDLVYKLRIEASESITVSFQTSLDLDDTGLIKSIEIVEYEISYK